MLTSLHRAAIQSGRHPCHGGSCASGCSGSIRPVHRLRKRSVDGCLAVVSGGVELLCRVWPAAFVNRPARRFTQVPSTAPFTEPSDPKTAPRLSWWLAPVDRHSHIESFSVVPCAALLGTIAPCPLSSMSAYLAVPAGVARDTWQFQTSHRGAVASSPPVSARRARPLGHQRQSN